MGCQCNADRLSIFRSPSPTRSRLRCASKQAGLSPHFRRRRSVSEHGTGCALGHGFDLKYAARAGGRSQHLSTEAISDTPLAVHGKTSATMSLSSLCVRMGVSVIRSAQPVSPTAATELTCLSPGTASCCTRFHRMLVCLPWRPSFCRSCLSILQRSAPSTDCSAGAGVQADRAAHLDFPGSIRCEMATPKHRIIQFGGFVSTHNRDRLVNAHSVPNSSEHHDQHCHHWHTS